MERLLRTEAAVHLLERKGVKDGQQGSAGALLVHSRLTKKA
jgi:hypothetical protein